MNRLLLYIGMACALLWCFVTAMTVGIPQRWCSLIDRMTFHFFPSEVSKMANGFYYDVNNHDMPTVMFLVVFGIIFLLIFYLIIMLGKKPASKQSLGIIIFFSIVFRFILWPGVMIHENDIYRYLWDGKSMVNGINPYKYAPADLFMFENNIREDFYDSYNEAWIRAKEFSPEDRKRLNKLIDLREQNSVYYQRIGYKEVPTIYPPVAQIVFALAWLLRQDSILLLKFIFILFDLSVIFLIIGILKHFNKNPCYSIVYAWSPLVLKEIANAGHYDSVAVFFTMLAVYLYLKRKSVGSTVSLALAALSKFFSGVLVVILGRSFTRRDWIIFFALCAVLYLPFLLWDQTGPGGVTEGLRAYNREWAYNASIFAVIYRLIENFLPKLAESYLPAKIIVGIIYLGILFILRKGAAKDDLEILHRCFLAIGALFILSPVGDPWYFCWVMPFLCVFPYRSWIILSGLLMLSYLNFQAFLPIVHWDFLKIDVISWIIYLPFFIILAVETRFNFKMERIR